MDLPQRVKYSFYLAIPIAALLALVIAIASADGVGFLPVAALDLVFSPLYFVVIYAASFIVAPLIAHRVPVSERQPLKSGVEEPSKNHIAFRPILLIAAGLLLVLAANLLVFFMS